MCDGELYRFDVNHPETNGMIEYFVRPMSGVRRDIGFSEWVDYSQAAPACASARSRRAWWKARSAPARSTCRSPARARRALATRPFKFTLTGPHMLAKTLHDRHYRDPEKLAHAIADVLAEQVKHLDADVVQVDEANLPGHPDEWKWAAATINKVLKCGSEEIARPRCTCASATTAGSRSRKAPGRKLMDYLNALEVDHIVMETAHRPPEELAVFKDLRREIGFGLGVVDIKQHRDRKRGGDRARDRARGQSPRQRKNPLHPPRLRFLDAQAQHGRRQDPRAGRGPRPLRGTLLQGFQNPAQVADRARCGAGTVRHVVEGFHRDIAGVAMT